MKNRKLSTLIVTFRHLVIPDNSTDPKCYLKKIIFYICRSLLQKRVHVPIDFQPHLAWKYFTAVEERTRMDGNH